MIYRREKIRPVRTPEKKYIHVIMHNTENFMLFTHNGSGGGEQNCGLKLQLFISGKFLTYTPKRWVMVVVVVGGSILFPDSHQK